MEIDEITSALWHLSKNQDKEISDIVLEARKIIKKQMDKIEVLEEDVEHLTQGFKSRLQMAAEYRILNERTEKYEMVLSSIANIDASFLNIYGDDENYSTEEELRRIHEIVTPIWNEIATREKEESVFENNGRSD